MRTRSLSASVALILKVSIAFLWFVAFAQIVSPAHAHTRSQSQSSWRIDADALEARVEADAVDVTRLYALGGRESLEALFAQEVSSGFVVAASGEPCSPSGAAHELSGATGRVIAVVRFVCPTGALARGPVAIESRLFLSVAPSHLHFLVVHDSQGGAAEAVLSQSSPSASLTLAAEPAHESVWGALARFFPVGAQHVWSGLDHIAFLLALLLLVGGRLRAALITATGFTLGHTLTLGLAATGVLHPEAQAIEALIGFTIAFVALEIGGRERMLAWSAPIAGALAIAGVASLVQFTALPALIWFGLAAFVYAYPRGFPRNAIWLAAVFGLIHGCGFAGALDALGLPRPRLLASLAGFNLGVEAAQAIVIVVAILVGVATQRAPARDRANATALAGAALFALGCYWFVGRLA
ncbi:MAG: HupE/UreJ family protein [Terricaulis sp.]